MKNANEIALLINDLLSAATNYGHAHEKAFVSRTSKDKDEFTYQMRLARLWEADMEAAKEKLQEFGIDINAAISGR